MNELSGMDYEKVLKMVRNWPPTQRFALVQDVLTTLASDLEGPNSTVSFAERNTLQDALGLLSTDEPPPSDYDIQQWLNERRQKRYG